MLQVFHLDVAKADLDVVYRCMLQRMFQVFHTYVASISSGCCIFAMAFNCFLGVLQVFQMYVTSVLVVRTYIASVSSGCRKSRSHVAYVALGPTCRSYMLQLMGCRRAAERAQTGA
jgi:hypothetical protein